MGILPSYDAAPASQEDRYFSQLTPEEQMRFKQETKDAIRLDFKTMRSKRIRSGVLVVVAISFGGQLFFNSSPSPFFPAPTLIKFMVAAPILVIIYCFFRVLVGMDHLESLVSKLSQDEGGFIASDSINDLNEALKRAVETARERAITKKENRS